MLCGFVAAALAVFIFATGYGVDGADVVQDARNLTGNLAACPGYTLTSITHSTHGLTAQLALAGKACNALGLDIPNLTIQVTYESQSRLHVNIFDTPQLQYTIPTSLIARPAPPTTSFTQSSDLIFNYDAKPFAFWITRRDDPNGTPLFDTRAASLPSKLPVSMAVGGMNRDNVKLENMGLVFEDQYLQLTTSLPKDANVYGLGEVVAGSGFRRDVSENGTIQTLWARDDADPIDENIYGSHPIYLEHRFNAKTQKSSTHGVFLLSSQGSDILLLTPPSSSFSSSAQNSLLQYRLLGGTLDLYFFSGPSPTSVIEQYSLVVGTQTWIPAWAFGFHLCRWGYTSVNETRSVVARMRAAGVPLETMWNDIDLYKAVRDFTTDPVSFNGDEVKEFIEELTANHQHYIPIVDAAIAKQVNKTDIYDPYTRGTELDVFIKNPDGTEYVGQVWPGYTVFPDWFAPNTQQYWSEAFKNWSATVNFSGIWLDMNEASSFCDGSCGTGIDISNTTVPFLLPGVPGNLVTDYPEGYNSTIFGPSGNITINGTLTFDGTSVNPLAAVQAFDVSSRPSSSSSRQIHKRATSTTTSTAAKKGLGAANLVASGANINAPPYTIHNGFGPLSIHGLATNATHSGGVLELDVHNMWGLMEEKATHTALLDLHPTTRPFLISRSTFPSSGRWTGHWLGDNFSKWSYMHYAIQGVLQFQIFQVPMVGSDTGGFNGNSDEELVGRWMQMSAFHPFFRNHNVRGAISQEPYVWDSVANASKIAIEARYRLLPYWYTLFANTSLRGTPPMRALFWEFPDEPELFSVDSQFMVGRDILVTPVLEPNVSTVDGFFPGRSTNTTWRSFFTHSLVQPSSSNTATLPAPLGTIPVHVRSGAALLLHAQPAYTIEETRAGPFEILVSLDHTGAAWGDAYLDDGISFPPGPNARLILTSTPAAKGAKGGSVHITKSGAFKIAQGLERVTVLGVATKPGSVSASVGAKGVSGVSFTYDATKGELVVSLGQGVSFESGAVLVSWV
ncbi:glycoside hydrolase family 31 protein [Sphaerobolus stellatus SS14]|uniref:Maltase n=1 Tax=Sphaerobolus stellatus (strain SS14) TaxID=990650 RepID=A0A0C9UIZ8_SPHS4|nr:glycoside hydrolase family 31 protein [Sphaerobolus stellatus SS14]